ncbi:cysteine hydrolase family protein [Streptococcus caballi]|uniref:cysteine hydrolase family protein n=1 Tax=Streptococcus caballi TaxID=439220 RepID=UPI00037CA174|nr:cysteine hydrolase family protein [Streptococcus caballi]
MKRALLVIDIQTLLVEAKPFVIAECLKVWQEAITGCREKGIEVIYIRHNDEELITGSRGWAIDKAVAPQAGEKIFDKHYNSAFKETGLQAYLDSQEIEHVIMMGMATNYCVDTTVKVAFELGYHVSVIENATTTFDEEDMAADQLVKHYKSIWNGRFAQVADLETILKED